MSSVQLRHVHVCAYISTLVCRACVSVASFPGLGLGNEVSGHACVYTCVGMCVGYVTTGTHKVNGRGTQN